MNPLQVYSRPRHLRYLFFIDVETPYGDVLALIKENLRLWGGQYNPIVPVANSVIAPAYLELIKHYDPDTIYHSPAIDPELIKQLRLFSPGQYLALDSSRNIPGCNALCLASTVPNKHPLITPQGLSDVDSPLLDYFSLNFGIRKYRWEGDDQLVAGREEIRVGAKEFNKLHEILHSRNPIIQSRLAANRPHTPILKNTKEAAPDVLEIVIAKDTLSTADLLYYWNRHLYEYSRIFYVTVEELSLLKQDTFFPYVLADQTQRGLIKAVSLSMSETEVQNVLETHFTKVPFHRQFQIKKIESFPFPVDEVIGATTPLLGQPTIQTLNAHETLLFVPAFPYASARIQPQSWAIDLQLMKLGSEKQIELHFPLTAHSGDVLRNIDSRLNRNRQLCYFVDSQAAYKQQVQIQVPSFDNCLHQLISHPVLDGTRQNTKFVHIGPHDPSSRLSAFIDLFGDNFQTIDEYFSDRFWADLFEDFCQSDEAAGDAISLTALVKRCRNLMEQQGINFGQWPATPHNDENLKLGLKEMLRELTDLTVLVPGHTLKCPRCATIAWYSLEEVTVRVRCSGCLVTFALPIDPPFTYRLNGLVQKNIFQSKRQRDGNLTIIRTLARLSKQAHEEFKFSPQLNLYTDLRSRKAEADIDIVAVLDGFFIIGEGKHDSSEFSADSHKSLLSLIEVANAVRPDRVVLSCSVDTHNRLEKAKKFLDHHFQKTPYPPYVEAFQIEKPTYINFQGASKYFYY